MTLCDLRRVPGNAEPYFTVTGAPDRVLVLSVRPDEVVACSYCPNRHVRVLSRVTPASVRELAESLLVLAAELERR